MFSDSIVPSASHYQVTPKVLNVVMKKASLVKWRALERDKHRASLNNSSLNSNHVSGSTDRKASSGSNSNDYEMNDLDATDDDTSHTSSLSQTSSQSSPTTKTTTTKPKTGQTGFNHEGTSNSSSAVETYPPSGEPKQNFHTNPLYTPPTTCCNCHHTTTPSHVCVPPSELEMTDPNYRYEQLRQPSLTGLVNPGNTCFMNSVLQCLSNTTELRDFFVSGRYLANINNDNPLGFEGKLAKCFSVILRKLWSGEYKYFSPKKLMDIVAKRSKSFDGHSQHDTHEFMSYLIDGLHEDLNRVHKKPTTKPVEMEGYPDRYVLYSKWMKT